MVENMKKLLVNTIFSQIFFRQVLQIRYCLVKVYGPNIHSGILAWQCLFCVCTLYGSVFLHQNQDLDLATIEFDTTECRKMSFILDESKIVPFDKDYNNVLY